MNIIVGIGLFLSLFGLFIFSYKANKRTKVPEGVDTTAVCGGCKHATGCKFRV
ncbi:MAG: hypothetical protein FWG63_04080 [Defluviitaleaceae bacterium]|nr:hypothetical protein [Defluviitaleaceae bacterium]